MKKNLALFLCLVLVMTLLAAPAWAATVKFSAGSAPGVKGSMENAYDVDSDVAFVLPESGFTRSGYAFAGWKVEGAGETSAVLQPGDAVYIVDDDAVVTVTAMWKRSGSGSARPDAAPVPLKPGTPGPDSFIDVKPGAWYYDAVMWASSQGLMVGYGNGSFGPGDPVTRAMVVQVLNNMVGGEAAKTAEQFTDVKASDWYAPVVSWAVEKGIAKGLTDNFFGAISLPTREDAIVMFYNCAKISGFDMTTYDDLADFSDVADIAPEALDALHWAVGNGLINGMGDGTLSPKTTLTRAQLSTMLMRYIT